jgi:hypothetical protein
MEEYGWGFQLKKEGLLSNVEGNPIITRHNDKWVGETWKMYFIMKKSKNFWLCGLHVSSKEVPKDRCWAIHLLLLVFWLWL